MATCVGTSAGDAAVAADAVAVECEEDPVEEMEDEERARTGRRRSKPGDEGTRGFW